MAIDYTGTRADRARTRARRAAYATELSFLRRLDWLLAAAVAALVALAIGLPPAWRARRLKIVDALSGH